MGTHLLLTFWAELPMSKLLKWARKVLKEEIPCKRVWKHTQWGRGRFSGFLVNLLSVAMAHGSTPWAQIFISHTRSNPVSRAFTR